MSDEWITIEQINQITGDDVEYWLNNAFVTPDDIAQKIRYWITSVIEAMPL